MVMSNRGKIGKKGESIAVAYLELSGYTILKLNYRNRLGEIDIIAKDKDTIVFIEVKARTSNRFGNPKWAVTLKKQEKISKVALSYLKEQKQIQVKARFDVVAVSFSKTPPGIELVKNAFELAYQ